MGGPPVAPTRIPMTPPFRHDHASMSSSDANHSPAPIVVKIGGALLEDAEHTDAFWQEIDVLRQEAPVVIVHGGGAQATTLSKALGHTPRMVHGRRVTSDQDLSAVLCAIRGQLNATLVAAGQQHGLRTVGISGADGGLVQVEKRPPWTVDGESVDFGWVGDVQAVQPDVLHSLLAAGFVPVVAPLGLDASGQLYNVNADTVAGAIARALGAQKFLLVTQTGGLLRTAEADPEAAPAPVTHCSEALFESGKEEGWIGGGMLVKLHVAFEALRHGIEEVFILAPDDLNARRRATQVQLQAVPAE